MQQCTPNFYADMAYLGAQAFQDDFAQSFPMEVCFVPMFWDKEETGIIITEKATFNSLADLLRTELYRGHVLGNTPLRCRHGSIWRFHITKKGSEAGQPHCLYLWQHRRNFAKEDVPPAVL